MRHKFPGTAVVLFTLGAVLSPALAGISTLECELTYSNALGAANYGLVTLSQNEDLTGPVTLTVAIPAVGEYGAGPFANFGMDKFALNLVADAENVEIQSLPAGWNAKANKTFSEFGQFAWSLSGPGARVTSLVFEIDGISITDFIGNPEYIFAAHIGGFDNGSGVESHFVAGRFLNPAPSAVLLGVLGLSALTAARRRLI